MFLPADGKLTHTGGGTMTLTKMDLLLRPHLAKLAKPAKDKECWRTEEEIMEHYSQYRTS
jgi:hypothetical protein